MNNIETEIKNQQPNNLYAIREKLAREGVRHKGKPVPFGVTDEYLTLPDITIERLRNAGNVTGRFLTAVNNLVTQAQYADLRQIVPELSLLDRPAARELNKIAPDLKPSMFRLDLIVRPDGGFEASEIELLFGGIGYTQVMRDEIFPKKEGEIGLGYGFAKMLNYLSNGKNERCSIITLNVAALKPYVDDLSLFAKAVRKYYPNYDLVFADELQQDTNGNLISADNPEPIRFVHRFFEIYMATNGIIPNFDLLVDAYKRGSARDLPTLKQFLEEKLTMALLWRPELSSYFEKELSPEGYKAIKDMLPKTYLLTPETTVDWNGQKVPLTNQKATQILKEDLKERFPGNSIGKIEAINFVQSDDLVASSKRKDVVTALQRAPKQLTIEELVRIIENVDAALTLSTIPRDKRQYVIKKSGFSEGAAEAKSVVLLADLSNNAAAEAIKRALESGDVYVLQHATTHKKFPVSGLIPQYHNYRDPNEKEPESLVQTSFEGYARVEPHYFQTAPERWEIGDISVTVTPDKKTHGRTDAIVTFVNF